MRVLRGIDPRLVSIKGFESSKGTNHEMSWHQVWEKVGFSLVKKQTYIFWEKPGFWKQTYKFVGFWCARYQFLHFWAPLLASRDPVGHQCREAAKFIKNSIFAVFLHVFGWFWLLPDRSKRGAKNSKIGARLDPDWIPTGQKRCPKMQKLVPDWVPTGSRLGPDWIPTRFLQKIT